MRFISRLIRAAFGLLFIAAAFYFFLIPEATVILRLTTDKGLRENRIPDTAFAIHHSLSPRYASYANTRVASGAAARLDYRDIAATEWPLFGSCFYLWATESLQDAWEADNSLSTTAPSTYAENAINAATTLVIDPGHAAWVKKHWGETDYLRRGNCFYRTLVISALTSHHNLTGSTRHLKLLRTQVVSLANEIDRSPHGLIDDYPNQCYPTDVNAAVAAILRADPLLGTDHSTFAERALRGFIDERASPLGLPPFFADSKTGKPIGGARGSSTAYFTIFAPIIWPERGDAWYNLFEQGFWQSNFFSSGFREYPHGVGSDFFFDIDAGPVISGYSPAASAFGLAAARNNNRYDHAFPLAAELLASSWPLPNGPLLTPLIASAIGARTHAPYLGECAVLFQLTRTSPASTTGGVGTGRIPVVVVVLLTIYFLLAIAMLAKGVKLLRKPPADH